MFKTIAFYHQSDKRVKNDYFLDNYDNTNEYVKFRDELGYEVHSLDIYTKQKREPDICIFLDMPTFNIEKVIDRTKTKTVVMLREAEMISGRNYDKNRHNEFDIVLTWKRDLVDNKKYFFFPSTRFVKSKISDVENYLNRKLLTLINSNLTSNIEGELYSKRLDTVKWFEINHLNDFDLWGYGWDEWRFVLKNRTFFRSKLLAPKRISYKGMAKDKQETMSQYKFSVCFENTNLIRDYISEKIFDSFLSQTVPIYWGAPNIDEIIPKNCFIDFRDFNNYEELYAYIKNMTNKDYMQYIENINTFLESRDAYIFTLDNWIKSLNKALIHIGEQ